MTEKHVLLVDDDESLRHAICRALRRAGFDVSACGSTYAALRELDGGAPFGLLICSVRMPRGQPHGFALARMARLRRPNLRVIYMTTHPELEDEDRAAAPGELIAKPFELHEIVNKAREQLAGPGAPASATLDRSRHRTTERPITRAATVIETARLLRREEPGSGDAGLAACTGSAHRVSCLRQ